MTALSIATNIPERFLAGQSAIVGDDPDALADWYSVRTAVFDYCMARTRRDVLSAMAVSRRKKRNYSSLLMRITK